MYNFRYDYYDFPFDVTQGKYFGHAIIRLLNQKYVDTFFTTFNGRTLSRNKNSKITVSFTQISTSINKSSNDEKQSIEIIHTQDLPTSSDKSALNTDKDLLEIINAQIDLYASSKSLNTTNIINQF